MKGTITGTQSVAALGYYEGDGFGKISDRAAQPVRP